MNYLKLQLFTNCEIDFLSGYHPKPGKPVTLTIVNRFNLTTHCSFNFT
jgi:hypothetical protein